MRSYTKISPIYFIRYPEITRLFDLEVMFLPGDQTLLWSEPENKFYYSDIKKIYGEDTPIPELIKALWES